MTNSFPPPSRPYFDVVVILPLEEELLEFLSVFAECCDRSTDTTFRCEVDSGSQGISVLAVKQYGMGKTYANEALTDTLHDFDAGIVVCLGIAASLTGDLRLGDVCYSTTIIDVLDNAKVAGQDGILDLALSPSFFHTDKALCGAFNFMRLKADLKLSHAEWEKDRGRIAKSLAPDPVPGRGDESETVAEPKSKEGPIVCGAVTKSDTYNAKLRQIDRKVAAIETESGGIFQVAQAKSIPAITVRGISDYGDLSKENLEAKTGTLVRKIAAGNAASFLRMQLTNPHLLAFLTRRRTQTGGQPDLFSPSVPAKRDATDIISQAALVIDDNLRELSPEFRLQPKGYHLPVPRIRQVWHNATVGDGVVAKPLDVRDALEPRKAILLLIPRTYPDYCLPWVLADDLLAAEVAGGQVVPVVIDGKSLGPPKSGFSHLAANSVADASASDGLQVVYIIDGLPLGSKSRLSFLKGEISAATEAKFIFISRETSALVELTEFANEQSADTFEICPIPFTAIAHFIQKNFGLDAPESEVVAKRLYDTFDQFDLSAHPAYFAGIPKETLSALLQANRRSELIQLAVDGFLTFVVAADRSDITLSRTTRSRFLRNLVVEMSVEKRTFTQEELVKFTRSFSATYDFDIDPLTFIQAFIDKGILHFVADQVYFSLPFIETYLLASELNQLSDIAARYFDPSSDAFDFATFDLYCEIGASDRVIDKLREFLQGQIDSFKVPEDEGHILISDRIHPVVLKSHDRLHALQGRLRKALEDVQDKRGDTKAKQRIIDLADHVKRVAAEQSQDAEKVDSSHSRKGAAEHDAFSEQLDEALRAWVTGVVLLGSGAEHLQAKLKRELSRQLVTLGSAIVHHWTDSRVSIDFKEIKVSLTREESVQNFIDMTKGNGGDFEETRTLLELLVDVMELHMLSQPLRHIMDYLCERARHKVLATSVDKATFEDPIERVLHSAWLADIESRRGKASLRTAIRRLPKSAFLRTTLANHFLARVHWSHWKKEDRLALLDAAEEAIKPLSLTFNKGELKRAIERTGEEEDKGLG